MENRAKEIKIIGVASGIKDAGFSELQRLDTRRQETAIVKEKTVTIPPEGKRE
jgi:hypothetical protein